MATSFNHNDTLKSTYSVANLPKLDWANDFGLAKTGDNEVIYAYGKSTKAGQPETVRFSIEDVKNVYSNTDIQPSLYATGKRGKSILVKLRSTLRDSNETDTVDYPIEIGTTIKFPVAEAVTPDLVLEALKREISILFNCADSSAELQRLMSGIMFQNTVGSDL